MNLVAPLMGVLLGTMPPLNSNTTATPQHRPVLHEVDVGRGGVMRADGRALNRFSLMRLPRDHVVYLRKDKDASYADMVKALRSLSKSSFYKVSLITEAAKAPR